MRLLHTADWHLGKTLKGQPLLDDQNFILEQILDITDKQKVDALLIAGDIYDRGIPPADAVELFDETLTKLAEKKIPTLIIAGNHDSATRLNFGSKLFERQNIFIVSKADKPINIPLEDEFGTVYFSMIPYFEPGEIRAKFFGKDSERLSFDTANKFYVDLVRKNIPANARSVAIAHAFIAGSTKTDSVREIVGCAEGIGSEIFSDYNYVALGHLHSPRAAGKNLRYSGSPLKYSFDEAKHKKSVMIIDIDRLGNFEYEEISLTPRHDVRVETGTLAELLRRNKTYDYICAQLIERVINVQDKLANVFPHLLSVEFDLPKNVSADSEEKNSYHEGGSMLDYFADFFAAQTGEALSLEYREAMNDFFVEMSKEE